MKSVNNKIFNKINLLDIEMYEYAKHSVSIALRTKFWKALGSSNPRSICILLKNKNF